MTAPRSPSSDELELLARLQLDALETPAITLARSRLSGEEYDGGEPMDVAEPVNAAAALAREHGFRPVGCGSTRVAVECAEGGAVAKVAFDFRGLLYNVQEATSWLALPEPIRHHMAPSRVLTPALVLVQERADVIGPPLTESVQRDTWSEQVAAVEAVGELIEEAERGLGFQSAARWIRPDNWGLHCGRVVALDYAEKHRPIPAVWAWALHRLDGGPLWLDRAARNGLYEQLAHSGVSVRDLPTVLALARRAGVSPADTDPCPCGSTAQPFGSCPGECAMYDDAASYVARRALIDKETPPARGPRDRMRPRVKTAEEAIGACLAAAAGIRGW